MERICDSVRAIRNKPKSLVAVIPSLSRDLGLATQADHGDEAENFRLRRCAPALKLTRACTQPQMRPAESLGPAREKTYGMGRSVDHVAPSRCL